MADRVKIFLVTRISGNKSIIFFGTRGFILISVKLKQLNKALVDKIIKQWFRYTKAWKQHDVTKIVNALIFGPHLPKQMKYYIFPGGIG